MTIDLEQVRVDLRGEIITGGGFFESIRVRLGYSDYTHTEFEGDEVGTLFLVEGLEGRLELVQADQDGWRGVIGGQMYVRDFNAIGAEAFRSAQRYRTGRYLHAAGILLWPAWPGSGCAL